jgi:hypothetical protein
VLTLNARLQIIKLFSQFPIKWALQINQSTYLCEQKLEQLYFELVLVVFMISDYEQIFLAFPGWKE